MKKNISITSVILLIALFLTSCNKDFLEVENPNGESIEEYYTTDAHVQEALTAAYDPLHWPDWGLGSYNSINICSEIMSDNVWVGGASAGDMLNWHKLANYDGDSNNTLGSLWTIDYSGIKRCNDVLQYIEWAKDDITEKNQKLYEAQARLLRVYYYNMLWHFFGNIPFYLENLTRPYQADQLSADKVYAQLIKELESVLDSNVLPMYWTDNSATDKNVGRVSQAMGYMLYAEMVMYQNDKARYPKALDYMKKIIADGYYGLLENFAALWLEENEWSKESIFEINYNDDNNRRGWGSPLAVGGTVLPTLISPNGWQGGMGLNAGADGWGFMPIRLDTYAIFQPEDKRIEGTFWDARGMEYSARYQDTGLWLAKYVAQSDNNKDAGFDNNLNYNNNLRIYRYAETLLNAAELSLEAGDMGAALLYINEVRDRAGLDKLTTVTLDDILLERRYEFVGEGKRYWDLVRTGKAATVLVAEEYRTNNWAPHNRYIPIPLSELDTSPNLVQNEGYN
ncbi:MAG: RagB/SusD family nutrient uptake outer membrane protein [Porphyromonas sp.]|nr:RagB/SusD family nutrient uptake outer membrane protein [Porphyromonas sp.]